MHLKKMNYLQILQLSIKVDFNFFLCQEIATLNPPEAEVDEQEAEPQETEEPKLKLAQQ